MVVPGTFVALLTTGQERIESLATQLASIGLSKLKPLLENTAS